MEIVLRNTESIRIIKGTSFDAAFIDVESDKNVSDNFEHYNEYLAFTSHEMHQIFIVKLERYIKTFVFKKEYIVKKSDFGLYSDGEILYTNSVLVEED